jgi:hypothetical protein
VTIVNDYSTGFIYDRHLRSSKYFYNTGYRRLEKIAQFLEKVDETVIEPRNAKMSTSKLCLKV